MNPKLFQQYKFNKENNPQTAKTKQTKNLKPSLVKKIKKSPPNNTKPNKLQFNYNLFKKQKSADTIPSDVKTPNLTFSKSADITNKFSNYIHCTQCIHLAQQRIVSVNKFYAEIKIQLTRFVLLQKA